MDTQVKSTPRGYQSARKLSWWLSWASLILGSTILAAGFVFFINPYNIVPGGVYGASIVLHNLFPSIQVGTFGYMFDIPLLILSMVLLGAKLGVRTIAVSLITPLIMNVMSKLVYPTQEALERLDPAQLLGGCMDMSDHLMLTCIIGATLIGIGSGIVVCNQATSGGSDVIGMMLQKYCHVKFSNAILMVDATVVCFGLVVIGFGVGSEGEVGSRSWLLSFYSLISIFVISRVIAFVINGNKDDKLLFVISDRKMEELRSFILNDLDRTATCIKSTGLYTGAEKEMLFLVVSHKEVPSVKLKIREVDPNAFVVVTDAYDTFGDGWKPLPTAGDIQPE